VSLLTPAENAAERALEEAMLSGIDISALGDIKDPRTCPPEALPFLAAELAISHWDTNWTTGQKREAVMGAIPFHKIKGTRAAVEQVLERFHPLLTVTEWWEANPPRAPHTFEVRAAALDIGAGFLTPETSEAIIRDVAAAKPLRAHFDFVQTLAAQGAIYLAAGGMAGSMFRADFAATLDTSRDWNAVWQTEQGEPIRTEDGLDYLETS
jgi:phage tail P2-like protein